GQKAETDRHMRVLRTERLPPYFELLLQIRLRVGTAISSAGSRYDEIERVIEFVTVSTAAFLLQSERFLRRGFCFGKPAILILHSRIFLKYRNQRFAVFAPSFYTGIKRFL